jgi:hypothetical protein
LVSSISIAEAGVGPEGIAGDYLLRAKRFRAPIWHSGAGKKGQLRLVRGGTRNFGVKPGLVRSVFHKPSMSPAFNGQLHDHFVFWGSRRDAVALSVLMAGAWLAQQRTCNSGWVVPSGLFRLA